MFNYDYFNELIRKLIESNTYPLQIELHPGSSCQGFNCTYCYGKGQYLTKGFGLTEEDYAKLIKDLSHKINFLTLSGISSDPLTNPNIHYIVKQIKNNNLRVGIHTKGLLLNYELSELLNINTAYGDFITFGIDASNSKIYNLLHGLPSHSNIFNIVKHNIESLFNLKLNYSSDLNINISYLLFTNNSSFDQLCDFVKLFSPISDRIKFSFPQIPNVSSVLPSFYIKDRFSDIEKKVKKVQDVYPNSNIQMVSFSDSKHQTSFSTCNAMRFQAVIDFNGYIFPCPQVATNDFKNLSYGNIRENNFWDIWNSEKRIKLLHTNVTDLGCRICDRKDENINIELEALL